MFWPVNKGFTVAEVQFWRSRDSVLFSLSSSEIPPLGFEFITQISRIIWRCMHRASSYNMYIKQQDA